MSTQAKEPTTAADRAKAERIADELRGRLYSDQGIHVMRESASTRGLTCKADGRYYTYHVATSLDEHSITVTSDAVTVDERTISARDDAPEDIAYEAYLSIALTQVTL